MKDYIGRDEAITAVSKVPRGNWSNDRYVRELEGIHAADVAPVVHARWILITSRDDINKPERYSWNCSHCWYRRKSGESSEIHMREPKGAFCERCGARMDGGEQDKTD